ncbi:MAG TPA: cupin domain-containing protein [Chloroflexota bacterium]|nr:cupin domain-containing protein [Chloroflexota bacterium]
MASGPIEPFYEWQLGEEIPIITGLIIDDLNEVELAPWDRMGGKGAFLNLGTRPSSQTSAYLCEIEPGGSLKPQSHLFDEYVYVVSGRGATTVWVEDRPKQLIEWQEGSFLAIPLNARHQHFNTSDAPARFLAYHDAPTVMNRFRNERFVFDNPFVFDDRFSGEAGYFSGEGTLESVPGKSFRVWKTNFVPDARGIKLYEWKERGAGGLNIMLEMAESRIHTHISQFPVGTYKKGHVDPTVRGSDPGGGSFLMILEGVGFTLVWGPGDNEFKRLDWKRNSLLISPSGWYHQHFNVGPTPARYLAMTGGGRGGTNNRQNTFADVSEREGGGQIEYPDENPEIHRIFEEALHQHGATCRMRHLSPFCTAEDESAIPA